MENTIMKRWISCVVALCLTACLTGCGSSEPCAGCGRTPTKGYKNGYTEETEYYCSACASDCEFCSDKATHSLTVLGQVVFACDDCYQQLRGK